MTDWFVRSGAGGTASGANWTNAKLTLAAAFSAGAAGDRFWVADDHAESSASAIVLTGPGTTSQPLFVYCVDHTVASPGTGDLKTTGSISTTGTAAIQINGFTLYNGIIFAAGSGSSAANIQTGSVTASASYLRFDNCAFQLATTAGSPVCSFGGNPVRGQQVDLYNCTFQTATTTGSIALGGQAVRWFNTPSAITGATLPTTLITTNAGANVSTCLLLVDGVDLSALGSGKTLVGATGVAVRAVFHRCKLGASVTRVATPTALAGGQIDFIQCDSGATGYFQSRDWYHGSLVQETTIVRSGGASDGTTPLSHKIVTTANAKWLVPFESFPIAIWNDTVGSSVTATVEIVASAGLNNDDVWLEVEYLGSSTSPLASIATSTKANNLASGSALSASSATWASSPGSPQTLSVSFTPQQAGDIRCCVKVGKASQTVYVDSRPTLSPAPKIARHDRIVAPGVYVNAPVGASRLVGGLLAA